MTLERAVELHKRARLALADLRLDTGPAIDPSEPDFRAWQADWDHRNEAAIAADGSLVVAMMAEERAACLLPGNKEIAGLVKQVVDRIAKDSEE